MWAISAIQSKWRGKSFAGVLCQCRCRGSLCRFWWIASWIWIWPCKENRQRLWCSNHFWCLIKILFPSTMLIFAVLPSLMQWSLIWKGSIAVRSAIEIIGVFKLCPLISTFIPGLFAFEPTVFEDRRGYFFESYNEKNYAEKGDPYCLRSGQWILFPVWSDQGITLPDEPLCANKADPSIAGKDTRCGSRRAQGSRPHLASFIRLNWVKKTKCSYMFRPDLPTAFLSWAKKRSCFINVTSSITKKAREAFVSTILS